MALGEKASKYFPCSCTGCPDINKDDKIDISDMVILTQHINEDAQFYNLNTNNNIVDSDDLRCVGEYISENPGIFSSCRTCTRKPTDNSCICPENTFKVSAMTKAGEVFGCSPIYCNHDVDCETEVRIYGNEIPLFCNRLSNEIFNWRIRQNCGIESCKGHDYCKEVPEGTGRLCGKKSYVCKEKAWTETVCGDKICEGMEILSCQRDCYGKCIPNTDCPAFQSCKNGICVDIYCKCGRIIDRACTKSQCCDDSQCPSRYCNRVTGKCSEQKDCVEDTDCKPNEACNLGKCKRAFTLVLIGMNYKDDEINRFKDAKKNLREFLEISPFKDCNDKERRVRTYIIYPNECPEKCEHCNDCINKGRKCLIEKHKDLAGFYDKFAVLTPDIFDATVGCVINIGDDGSMSYDRVVERTNVASRTFLHEIGHQLGLCHDNCGFPPQVGWDKLSCPNRLDSDFDQEELGTFIMGACKRLKYGPNAYNFLKTKFGNEPPNSVGLAPWLTGC